jgi:C_GCAxxG_C_C family probable redox protein
MGKENMTAGKAGEMFTQGFHCSQVVFSHAAEELGLDKETALRLSGGFGAGLFQGEVCGCVSGAVMALGLQYGYDKPNDAEASAELTEKVLEFQRRFKEENGSTVCRELVGFDFAQPGEIEKAKESGKFMTVCTKLAESACAILDVML